MRCFVLVGLRDLFFFQAEDGIRDIGVTGVQTCALPILPLWTLPVAIGAGNAYILKPSERTPMSAVRLGELLVEAGLPEGVFSIVNGAREAVDSILEHPGIKAVSFVGSHPVAEHVYTLGAARGKRVQALAGAKNSMIVLPDAVLEKAVPNIISSAYGNEIGRAHV